MRIACRSLNSSTQARPSIGLLGLCDDVNSSYLRGPALAPPIIRACLRSESANSFCEQGIDVLGSEAAPTIVDFGDLSQAECNHENIRGRVREVLQQGLAPMILGGDHSISFPVVTEMVDFRRTHLPRSSSNFTIVHLDAHTDLYEELGGNRLSHGCPFTRVMEQAEESVQLVQAGIRTATQHHRDQWQRFNVQVVEAADVPHSPQDMRDTMATLLPPGQDVYLSVDLDVLDPAFAPGVSHHEPGGLTSRQVLDLVRAIPESVKLIGADLVEFNPNRDTNGMTGMVAAKLCKEIMGRMILDHGAR
eukprot:TRINITY_DN43903_c0_g1_i1.p1 TRINITY_DN43903_c0_g1~~TRINITY_DN43903_c0_g1_i1.p1  ORF type:complete len:305 (+),score=56.24 TRINITY_DN43903_c0_g1_i1:177-1091(+)